MIHIFKKRSKQKNALQLIILESIVRHSSGLNLTCFTLNRLTLFVSKTEETFDTVYLLLFHQCK